MYTWRVFVKVFGMWRPSTATVKADNYAAALDAALALPELKDSGEIDVAQTVLASERNS